MTRLRIFKDVKSPVPRKKLAALFEAIAGEESLSDEPGQINLVFTGDARIRALNKRFRLQDTATDVLSFHLDEPTSHEDVAGEIYISVPTAKRQARQFRSTLTEELLHLACHGFLHFLGYDHSSPAQMRRMKAREEYFLGKLRRA
jgi:probable rRNA maturation factor